MLDPISIVIVILCVSLGLVVGVVLLVRLVRLYNSVETDSGKGWLARRSTWQQQLIVLFVWMTVSFFLFERYQIKELWIVYAIGIAFACYQIWNSYTKTKIRK